MKSRWLFVVILLFLVSVTAKEISAMVRDYALYKERRKNLVAAVRQKYNAQEGTILLSADFEQDRIPFRQESSFFYYSGIEEPGAVLTISVNDGKSCLLIPHCSQKRSQWVTNVIHPTLQDAQRLALDEVVVLGKECMRYQMHPYSSLQEYAALIELLKNEIGSGRSLFALAPSDAESYVMQRFLLDRLAVEVPHLKEHTINISSLVAAARRCKDKHELEALHKAIEITALAQEAAARSICDGATEAEVQGALEYIMIGSGLRPSFPSIVAAGKNSTILHHRASRDTMHNGDVVIVDIGAEYDYYCADITRTFPVSGKFTKRQRDIYNLVLETQEYIASLAQPGYWLSNKEHPDKSLNHLARAFLKEKGYDQYFTHGIGHYLGMDVHDVGDYETPLQEGDVITIEPGIYLPEENIGIRIEDNYWIVAGGPAICLSEGLPNTARDMESIVKEQFD